MKNSILTQHQKDLHRVAHHEAGHAFMCARCGGMGFPRVWKTNSAAADTERAWAGHCGVCVPGAGRRDLAKIAVAGAVAEYLYIAGGDGANANAVAAAQLAMAGWDGMDCVSESDRKLLCGAAVYESDFIDCSRDLLAHWQEVTLMAVGLVADALEDEDGGAK